MGRGTTASVDLRLWVDPESASEATRVATTRGSGRRTRVVKLGEQGGVD